MFRFHGYLLPNAHVFFRCVVWTGDGRVFFYNPSTRTSVWERPEDLLARADVDKAVSTPPEQLLGTLEKEKKPETQPPIEISTNKVEIESITEDEAPNKKLKLSVNGKNSADCVTLMILMKFFSGFRREAGREKSRCG